MAIRRMISLQVIDNDDFLDMSLSAQALYMHLVVRADDEGFVRSPKSLLRTVGCSNDDLTELIDNGFIIKFDSGVIVIRHWKIQNKIQPSRGNETIHINEKAMLEADELGVYYLAVDKMSTQYSLV